TSEPGNVFFSKAKAAIEHTTMFSAHPITTTMELFSRALAKRFSPNRRTSLSREKSAGLRSAGILAVCWTEVTAMNTNGSRASSTRPLSRIAQTAFPVRERLIPVLWPSAGGEFEARDRWGVVSSVIGEHLPLDDRDGCHDEEQ